MAIKCEIDGHQQDVTTPMRVIRNGQFETVPVPYHSEFEGMTQLILEPDHTPTKDVVKVSIGCGGSFQVPGPKIDESRTCKRFGISWENYCSGKRRIEKDIPYLSELPASQPFDY